jgi:hypothetical protein
MRVLADMLYSGGEKRENADKYRFFDTGCGGSMLRIEPRSFTLRNSTA